MFSSDGKVLIISANEKIGFVIPVLDKKVSFYKLLPDFTLRFDLDCENYPYIKEFIDLIISYRVQYHLDSFIGLDEEMEKIYNSILEKYKGFPKRLTGDNM